MEDNGGDRSEGIVKIQFLLRAMATSIAKAFCTITA